VVLGLGMVAGAEGQETSYTAWFTTTTASSYTLGVPDTLIFHTSKIGDLSIPTSNLAILLCQTSGTISSLTPSNSWAVGYVSQEVCLTNGDGINCAPSSIPVETYTFGQDNVTVLFNKGLGFDYTKGDTLSNFFFCFSSKMQNGLDVCNYPSTTFNITENVENGQIGPSSVENGQSDPQVL